MKKIGCIAAILIIFMGILSGCMGIKTQAYKRDIEKMGGLPVTVVNYDANSENGMISEFTAGSDEGGGFVYIIEFRSADFAKKYFDASALLGEYCERELFSVELNGRFICVINKTAEDLLETFRSKQRMFS